MGFSHPSSCHGRPFCAGVILEKLHIYSASDDSTESTPGVFDKHVKLHQFGIYWDWNQSHFIDTSSPETLQQGMLLPFSSPPTSSSPLPLHYLLTPLSLEVEIHVDTRRAYLRRPSLDQAIAETSKSFTLSESSSEQLPSLKPLQRCYHVVHSISPDASLEDEWSSFRMRLLAKHGEQWQSEEALQLARRFCECCHERMTTAMPVVAMEGEMRRFAVVVDRQQYGDILEFVSSLSTQILRAKYQRFRPKTSVETSPRAWWRFAIRSVVEENQRRRTNHGWKAYVKFKQMRAEYIELYRKKKDSKQAAKDPKLLARLQKLEDRLSVENVLLFRKVATNQLPEEGRRRGLFRRSSRRSLSVSRGVEESGRRSPRSEAGWLELLEVADEADEADESPWEGGSPRDGQLEIGFKLQRMSLSLVDGAAKVGMCKLEDGGVRFVKQREFVQCWLGVSEIQVTDRREDGSEWKRILYAEKDALFDATRIVPFLPKELLAQDSPPFLQVALEAPVAGDMDVRIRVCSLPLCIVGNLPFLASIAGFVMPPLEKSRFCAFESQKQERKRRMKQGKRIAREVAAHKRIDMDVAVGAVHVVIPEDVSVDVEHTQALVLRLGDLAVHSVPSSAEEHSTLTEATAYDRYLVTVSHMGVFMTGRQREWTSRRVQLEQHLSLVDDFELSVTVGLSVAPSELAFPAVRVSAALSLIQCTLSKRQYMDVLTWVEGVTATAIRLMNETGIDLSSLSSAATTAVVSKLLPTTSRLSVAEEGGVAVTEAASEAVSTEVVSTESTQSMSTEVISSTPTEVISSTPTETTPPTQHQCLLEVRCALEGLSLALRQSEETPLLVTLEVKDLHLAMERRIYDLDLSCSLSSLAVQDYPQGEVKGCPTYMVLSQAIDETGAIVEDERKELIRIHVHDLKHDAPIAASYSSDTSLEVEFGSLSRIDSVFLEL